MDGSRSVELSTSVRVYRKEFVFDARFGDPSTAFSHAQEYEHRLPLEDIEIRLDHIRTKPHEVWVRRWNLAGEFKRDQDAEEFAEGLDGEVAVVDRNSREEHALLSYGKVKLVK